VRSGGHIFVIQTGDPRDGIIAELRGAAQGHMAFTSRQIASLKPKPTRYEIREPGRTGLIIRITPDGTKTFTYRYRFNGGQRRLVLGTYPGDGLADARVALADAKKKVDAGEDPAALVAETRQKDRDVLTVSDLIEEYITRHAKKTMRPITAREDERMLRRDVLPHWRARLATTITRRDIITLLDRIEDRGAPTMRNRVAGVLNRLFFFALDRGIVEASPAIRIRRLQEQARTQFLSKDQIRSFWHGLDKVKLTPILRVALRWLVVMGQRRGESAGARRDEIDETARLWRIPAERTKSDRDHIIPLPGIAMRLLADVDRARVRAQPTRLNRKDRRPYDPTPSPWLFPSVRHDRPITPHALTHALTRHRVVLGIGDCTIHDLRRTFATWHGELGTPPDILSSLLSHAPNTITKQVYDHSTGLEPKRQWMEKWSAWLERVLAGEEVKENVIEIATARRRAR
jgi:integrase